jgi:hypothetical protein
VQGALEEGLVVVDGDAGALAQTNRVVLKETGTCITAGIAGAHELEHGVHHPQAVVHQGAEAVWTSNTGEDF